MSFSLGLIEVQSLGHAIAMTDEMLKAADVEFVATERRLGGRLVTIVIKGEVSAVTASIEAGKRAATQMGALKAAEVIARPHPEIFKFLNLKEDKKTAGEEKVIPAQAKSENISKAAPKKSAPKKTQTSSKAAPKKTASDNKKAPVKGQKTK